MLYGTETFINKKAKARRLVLIYLITKTLKVKKPWLAKLKIPIIFKNIKILNFYNFTSYCLIRPTVKAINSFLTIFILVANIITPFILTAYCYGRNLGLGINIYYCI